MTTGRTDAPTLTTGRLTLRPLSPSDVDALHRISDEPLVRRYLWDDEPVLWAAVEEVVESSRRTFREEGLGLFGVRLHDSERLLGFCGFVRLEGMREMELAYELAPDVWGRGIATEAARACVRYALVEVGMERVISGADPPNAASLRVLEKLGMRPIGNINPSTPEEPYHALGSAETSSFQGTETGNSSSRAPRS
jgi:RimJ/RimL family protein N-acetyltransferase